MDERDLASTGPGTDVKISAMNPKVLQNSEGRRIFVSYAERKESKVQALVKDPKEVPCFGAFCE
jgi:hypothetical protein